MKVGDHSATVRQLRAELKANKEFVERSIVFCDSLKMEIAKLKLVNESLRGEIAQLKGKG